MAISGTLRAPRSSWLVTGLLALAIPALADRERPVERPAERAAPAAALPNPLAVIYFDSGSTEVEASPELSAAATWLAEHPNRLLVIEGYADHLGPWRRNLRLSQDRADAVRDELVRIGADPLRLVTAAHSEDDPATDLAHGRRVEISGTLHAMPELVREQESGGQLRRPDRG